MVVIVSATGEITVVAHVERDSRFLAALGPVEGARRGGHVLPAHPVRRQLFRVIRGIFGWAPRIVGWTRRWRGHWMVDLTCSGGPVLGPFADRQEAVRAEEEWLVDSLCPR